MRADLLEDVGRGIEENAVDAVVPAHEERGLRACPGAHGSRAHARAIAAVAVPLREAAAGRGSEDGDSHGRKACCAESGAWRRRTVATSAGGDVHGDFEAEAEIT